MDIEDCWVAPAWGSIFIMDRNSLNCILNVKNIKLFIVQRTLLILLKNYNIIYITKEKNIIKWKGRVIGMWKVYRWFDNDILDEEGYEIYSAGWNLIGSYDTIDTASSVVKHEIYLYNCVATDDTPTPKFRIDSDFE